MKSPIIFNFDRNIIFIILQYISLYFTGIYSIPIFIKEIILLISMIISLICFFKRNKFSNIDMKIDNERYFQIQKTKINDAKKGIPEIKDYLFIIFFYFLLEIEIIILKIIFNTFHFKYKILKLTNMKYIIIYNNE